MHQKVTLWLRDSCYNKETVEQAVIIHRRCKPKYEPDEIILLCNYLHCYSGHGGTWAAAVADSIKKYIRPLAIVTGSQEMNSA